MEENEKKHFADIGKFAPSELDLELIQGENLAISGINSLNYHAYITGLNLLKDSLVNGEEIDKTFPEIFELTLELGTKCIRTFKNMKYDTIPHPNSYYYTTVIKTLEKVENANFIFSSGSSPELVTFLQAALQPYQTLFKTSYKLLDNKLNTLSEKGLSDESLYHIRLAKQNIGSARVLTKAILRYMQPEEN
jgi:hypothetical protein